MKLKYKYKINTVVFIALSKTETKKGIITKHINIGARTPYYKIQIDGTICPYFPEYRLGLTEKEALETSNNFNNNLFN